MKEIIFVREIPMGATARTCACGKPATNYGYTENQQKQINESSQTPLCSDCTPELVEA